MNASAKRQVGIVDYDAGNIRSIEDAFGRLGAGTTRVRAATDLESCTHIVLPGVGAFGFCAGRLAASGLVDSLHGWALEKQRPLLGICVGMQLLADGSEESPEASGLGWVGGRVRRIPTAPSVRVPHVGWNTISFTESHGEYAADATADVYFDHSYAYEAPTQGRVLARCRHGIEFAAAVARDNIVATQFHPEKSQEAGMRFLKGFLAL